MNRWSFQKKCLLTCFDPLPCTIEILPLPLIFLFCFPFKQTQFFN